MSIVPKVSISGPWWTVGRKVIIAHWLWMIFYVYVAQKGASTNPTDFLSWTWAKLSAVAHWGYQAVTG